MDDQIIAKHPDAEHVCGPGCGHTPMDHEGHTDYIVDGRLHCPMGDHCIDHGPVEAVEEHAQAS